MAKVILYRSKNKSYNYQNTDSLDYKLDRIIKMLDKIYYNSFKR